MRPTKKAEVFLKVLRVEKRSCMRTRYVTYGDVMRGCGEARRGDWILGISAGHAKMSRPFPTNLNMPRATKVD